MEKDKLYSEESVNTEYKVEIPPKSEKYMKTVVAYANGRGGRIVFGIDDKTLKVVGINPDSVFQAIDAVTNAVSDSCEPRIYPDITLQTINDKMVIVVEIHPGPMRPYYIKSQGVVNGTYIRVAGTTRHAEEYMLKELIANAVAHRSYLEPGNIQVAIFDDRLEVTSPGMLLNMVSIRKMMEGYSKLRNPAIASAFAYMKIIEKWGTGIPRVLRECREYGLPEPKLIDFDGDFRVNMYRDTVKSNIQITTQTTQTTQNFMPEFTENDIAILKVIQHNPKLTQKEIAMELDWTIDRVKYYLNKMKKQAVIKRVGSSHNGHWDLLIEI